MQNKAHPSSSQAQRQEDHYPIDLGRPAGHRNIKGYNTYEILLQTAKGQLLVFKHAIATIEIGDEPKGYRADTSP